MRHKYFYISIVLYALSQKWPQHNQCEVFVASYFLKPERNYLCIIISNEVFSALKAILFFLSWTFEALKLNFLM